MDEKMESAIKELVAEALEVDTGRLSVDTDLFGLDLDSMKAVELIMNLEDKFGVTFSEEDLLVDNLKTIGKIAALLEKYGVKGTNL